jgi:DNA-binding NarL/FixJ family response regulator
MAPDPARPARVFLLEDDPLLRSGLIRLVEQAEGFELAGEAGSVAEGLAGLAGLARAPDLLLADLGMPDGSGLEVVRAVRDRSDARILIFTVFGDQTSVISALEAGADGFVLKDSRPDDLVAAMRSTLAGGAPISAAAAAHLLRRLRSASASASAGASASAPAATTASAREEPAAAATGDFGLTPREKETLELLARGFSQKEVARKLDISPHTVGAHVKAIYSKMAVNSRSEAVFEAVQSGLIDLSGRAVAV